MTLLVVVKGLHNVHISYFMYRTDMNYYSRGKKRMHQVLTNEVRREVMVCHEGSCVALKYTKENWKLCCYILMI